jgi:hypothetical protein
MKKISFLALAFISTLAVSAQQDPDKAHKPMRTDMSVQTRFGLRAGVNLASLELDDDYSNTNYSTNSKTSFHAGAFVNIPIGGVFRFQPEVSYVGQGSKVNGAFVSTPLQSGRYELDFHYIAVPLMLQAQTNSGFFVEAGPQVALLLKAQEEQENTDVDLKDNDLVRTTDFGAAAGIGYLSRIGLGLNARYVHGFSNVFNSDDAPNDTQDREISNRGVQIGLVYHFGAHK